MNTGDNRLRFTNGEITITTGQCSFVDGKHQMADPASAKAYFKCCGTEYNVANTVGAMTVEDWYLEELVPKRQMLDLLLTVTA